MWTIPLGLPIRSSKYSSLVTFSGLAMGFAYQAGSSLPVPFPLCLMTKLFPDMSMGNFYMGAWIFFAIVVCLLGSNHPVPSTEQDRTSHTKFNKPASTIVNFRSHEDEKMLMKTRVVDTDTEDEEPLVMATVVGEPVSSPLPFPSTTSNTNARKYGRCSRPVHGTRAMQCCWTMHFFLSLYLIFAAIFVVSLWWGFDPGMDKSDSTVADDDGWFFGWDSWYLWLLFFFMLMYSYRVRRYQNRRSCGCRRNFSQQ